MMYYVFSILLILFDKILLINLFSTFMRDISLVFWSVLLEAYQFHWSKNTNFCLIFSLLFFYFQFQWFLLWSIIFTIFPLYSFNISRICSNICLLFLVLLICFREKSQRTKVKFPWFTKKESGRLEIKKTTTYNSNEN